MRWIIIPAVATGAVSGGMLIAITAALHAVFRRKSRERRAIRKLDALYALPAVEPVRTLR